MLVAPRSTNRHEVPCIVLPSLVATRASGGKRYTGTFGRPSIAMSTACSSYSARLTRSARPVSEVLCGCVCQCGTVRDLGAVSRKAITKSCGCLNRDAHTRHGHSVVRGDCSTTAVRNLERAGVSRRRSPGTGLRASTVATRSSAAGTSRTRRGSSRRRQGQFPG
jgi:hypothetical protein